MINFVLFTSVIVVFYGIQCMIEQWIFGSTHAKHPSAIQSGKNSDSNPCKKQNSTTKKNNAFKTDLEISKKTNTAPLARELQAWEPEEKDEVAELECLEKEGEVLKGETILSPEEMYRLNPDVQSTFLEDLSQYTTKLDITSLSKEQIEFAERMANEIMRENKQRKNKQRRRNSKRKRNN